MSYSGNVSHCSVQETNEFFVGGFRGFSLRIFAPLFTISRALHRCTAACDITDLDLLLTLVFCATLHGQSSHEVVRRVVIWRQRKSASALARITRKITAQ